jgi:hypothetical protein
VEELDTSRTYHVYDMYSATIQQKEDGSYEITYLDMTFKIHVVVETLCGQGAVLSVGSVTKSKKKLPVKPSPILRKEGPP